MSEVKIMSGSTQLHCAFCGGNTAYYSCNDEMEKPDGIICLDCRIAVRFQVFRFSDVEEFDEMVEVPDEDSAGPFGVAMSKMTEAWNLVNGK